MTNETTKPATPRVHCIIDACDFLFMSRFASDEETRYYLRGVYAHPAPNGDLMLAATDGHRLGVMRLSKENGEAPALPDGKALLPDSDQPGIIIACNKALLTALKRKPGIRSWRIYLRVTDATIDVVCASAPEFAAEATGEMVECSFPLKGGLVDGTFPDYVRVVPQECSGLASETRGEGEDAATTNYAANAAYMQCFGAYGAKGSELAIHVTWNGGSPALVANTDPRFLGVLMPVRWGAALGMERRAAVMDGPAVAEPAAEPAPEMAAAAE